MKDFLNNIARAVSKLKSSGRKPVGKRYKCQICGRMIHQSCSLEHAKAEEYILKLIRKDHPRWDQAGSTCPECIEYYRKLINQAEI